MIQAMPPPAAKKKVTAPAACPGKSWIPEIQSSLHPQAQSPQVWSASQPL